MNEEKSFFTAKLKRTSKRHKIQVLEIQKAGITRTV